MTDYGLDDPSCGAIAIEKTPDEIVLLTFDWAARLDGETISSRSFELPDGLVNAADAASGTKTTIRVSGGDACRHYRVIGKIVTSGTRTLEWVKRVAVREG